MTSTVSAGTLYRLLVVTVFLGLIVGVFGYFWVNTGGRIPGVTNVGDYQVTFRSKDVNNLVETGEVRIAGVDVGRVTKRDLRGEYVRVELALQPEFAPLHRGATVRIGVKNLLGASFVDITDGKGPAIPAGTTLPDSAVQPPVQVHNVIAALKPETRAALRGTVRSLGAGTKGTKQDIDRLMSGAGKLGREGYTALDAIAKQTGDLQALSREATQLLDTLDTGRGQIATVVQDAQRLTDATSGQRQSIQATVRQLPGVLTSARIATEDLTRLSGSLAPVAADLRRAAPGLNRALLQLPATTSDLRGLLPALDRTLVRAPATLDRVPTLGADVRSLVPVARPVVRDANPMLAYLAPSGQELGSMLASFSAAFETQSENGLHVARLVPVLNSSSFRGYPAPVKRLDPTHWTNPYPTPGQAGNTGPFNGEYPRLERAPR